MDTIKKAYKLKDEPAECRTYHLPRIHHQEMDNTKRFLHHLKYEFSALYKRSNMKCRNRTRMTQYTNAVELPT